MLWLKRVSCFIFGRLSNQHTFPVHKGARCDNINNLSEDKSPHLCYAEKRICDIKGWWELGSLRFVAPPGVPCSVHWRLVALEHECFMLTSQS